MVLYLLRYDVTERCGEQWNSGVKGREVRKYRVTGLGSVAGRMSGRAEVMRRRAKGTSDAIESDGAIKLVCPTRGRYVTDDIKSTWPAVVAMAALSWCI